MFDIIGDGKSHACNGKTRRELLQIGTLGAIGLSLPQLLAAEEAVRKSGGDPHDDRSAIMIFNLGAPSNIDLWDMKPDAPREVRGPFKPLSTKADFQISEVLPEHAKIADKFSLVRSCYNTGAAVHDVGWQIMQTGRIFSGGIDTPHVGSVVEYLRGRKTDLPAHVVLPYKMGRGGGNLPNGQAGGFLGKTYDPFELAADPSKEGFEVPDLQPPPQIGSARLERRRQMRDIVEGTIKNFENSENAQLLQENFTAAYRLMTSKQAREAFDLTKEKKEVRERYGMNRFGQSCLLARRLIEAGVRFVTLNTFLTVFDEITWDIHGSKPFTSVEGMKNIVCPMYDKAYAALITDLEERGMLEKTLVCNLAEFGRTPRINPAAGRDHWPQCYSVYFAGGGVQGGRAIGKSDAIGAVPVEDPFQPKEVVATIFKSLGFDLTTELPGPGGRPFPIVDFGAKPIQQLF
jgi:hypothetical protein